LDGEHYGGHDQAEAKAGRQKIHQDLTLESPAGGQYGPPDPSFDP
jgi:hypothetical protein